MEEFNNFMLLLFQQLATGNSKVMVECANGKEFAARVTGYSEEYMSIDVEFDRDDLIIPERVEENVEGFGYGMEQETCHVIKNVPVKRSHANYTCIKLTN